MTFKVLNLGVKQPYFNSAYVVRVPIFSFTTVRPLFGPLQPGRVGNQTNETKARELIWLQIIMASGN